MWWLAVPALAGVDAVVADGRLRPGRPAEVWVAATDDAGRPLDAPPPLEASGAAVRGTSPVRPGVWRWTLVPALDATRVEVVAGGVRRSFPVEVPGPSALQAPAVVDAVARGEPVSFVVGGVRPEDVEVTSAEGRVTVAAAGSGVEVTVALDDLPYPRWVPIAVRDLRSDAQPAWVGIRVRARPRVPIEAEPGATLELRLGSRTYGPFAADAAGSIDARVEQFPGEASATAILRDDLGNETRTDVLLAVQTAPSLLAVRAGSLVPGRPPPGVFVRALSPGGGPAGKPTCRTPAGALPALALDARTWWVAPPASEGGDLRVACTVGSRAADVRIPVAEGVPAHISLRAWPNELTTAFPVADLVAGLEDLGAERLPVVNLSFGAAHGAVAITSRAGATLRGEYTAPPGFVGEDTIVATYIAPPGAGPVADVIVGWGPPEGDTRAIYARAVDASQRPLAGVEVRVEVRGRALSARTGADGWGAVRATLPGLEPAPITAEAGRALRQALILPAEPALGGPGTPDLREEVRIEVRPGRVAGVSIGVTPSPLRASPGATALVTVRLEDSEGEIVRDEEIDLSVSSGTLGPLRLSPDGSRVAEYAPEVTSERREVEFQARAGSVRSTTAVVVEPRALRFSVGVWGGGQTNLGAIAAPVAGLDLDLRARTPLTGDALSVRIGASVAHWRDEPAGTDLSLATTLVPVSLALVLRDERGPIAAWAGAGFQAGPGVTDARLNGVRVRGVSPVLGPMATAGAGLRLVRRAGAALGAELGLSLTASWLPATDAALGYRGNLGGLVGGLGYRVVF